ncbi:MAG TPA: hypothetical protein VF912_11515 [Anaeromyxobacter sp.]
MGNNKFSAVWFAVLLLGMSVVAVVKGGQIAWKRHIDNPFLEARGGRAIAIGLAVLAVGAAGIAMAVVEGLKLR